MNNVCEKSWDKTPLQVYVPKNLKKSLKRYCVHNDENMTNVVVKILNDYLRKESYIKED